jgi:hypothetical protein
MREASVHTGHTQDGTPAAPGRLGNEQHHRNRRALLDERVRRGYHPRRGGRYDSEEDRSPSPEPLGPRAFSRAIRRAPFPARFRALTTITKYSGETRPELWLADYQLACQLGGTDDDNLIIRNLPLFLSDVCPNSCMLFFEEDDKLDRCKHCEASRYVEVTNDEGELVVTKVAAKQLRRLPIIPRLSRLFLNKEIALHMTWPKNGLRLVTDPDIMVHPSDGEAWKAFDEFDPEFANDPRSVRLGLSMDGFTPFNSSASPYSCWPVFIVPYNLPPELVNKEEFMFLALVIPGPSIQGES